MNNPGETPSFETRAIHDGLGFTGNTGSVIPPVYLTSTFAHGNADGFDYTRSGNPNFRILESQIASLEGAAFGSVFASGVSAITAVVSTLSSGDRVLAEENIYGCTFRLFDKVFAKFGVEVDYVDFTQPEGLERLATTKPKLVWIESPTNPSLKVLDIRAIADAAHAVGVPVLVDNTFASSYLQQPLSLGADLSLISLTKYTNGHSDALAGAVCCNDSTWAEKMVFAQKALGLQPSPFDCWLISRGAKTMALRMERHSANALRLAEALQNELGWAQVRYPWLPSHPQHTVATKQMRGGSGIVTADPGWDLETTIAFLKRLKWFTMAESLGGIESLICHPASMTHASIPRATRLQVGITDSLIRFSVGIESIDDLLSDIRSALPS